jgi:hypothetical protein
MMQEEQLEIEVAVEILPDTSPDIMAPDSGLSIKLSPARSSAFSTPSRSPSRHSSVGGDDLEDEMPSAVFSSFSASPGATASNPSTPDRGSRISTTIIISPKRGNSPGLSETSMQPNQRTPQKTTGSVASTTPTTPNHSPDRSAAAPSSETVTQPSPSTPQKTSSSVASATSSTPNHSPDRSAAVPLSETVTQLNQSVPEKTSSGASTTITPNHSPDRSAVVPLSETGTQLNQSIPEKTSSNTPNHSPDRLAAALLSVIGTQQSPSMPTSNGSSTTTPKHSPDRSTVVPLSETGTQPNQSIPEETSNGSSTTTPKHSPGRSAVEPCPSLPPTVERGDEAYHGSFDISEATLEMSQPTQSQTAASATPSGSPGRAGTSSGAPLRNETKITVTANESMPLHQRVDASLEMSQPTQSQTAASATPSGSPGRAGTSSGAPLRNETKITVTANESMPLQQRVVRTPDGNAPSISSNEQSAPEKDTLARTKIDPNYTLHQIAAGSSSNHTTPERINYSKAPEENNASAAVPAPPPEDETPRVSNHEHKSMSVTSSVVESVSTAKSRSAGSVVESVSTGLQQAFHSLHNYLTDEPPSAQGAGILDTSAEQPLTDLDMQELMKEIRVTKNGEEKKEQHEKEEVGKEPTATDDIRQPLAPLPDDRPPSKSPAKSRSRKERLERLHNNAHSPGLPVLSTPLGRKKAPESTPSTAPCTPASNASSPFTPYPHYPAARTPPPRTPPRATIRGDGGMTPIMRMRTTGSPETPMVEPSPPRKSDEEVKASKQRKWKDKLKLAEKNREIERQELDGRGRGKEGGREKESRRKSKKTASREASKKTNRETSKKTSKKERATSKKKREDDTTADPSYMQCQDGFSKLMETLMQGRCGELNDTFSIFDESDTDNDGSLDSENDSASEEEKGTSTDEDDSEDESGTQRDDNLRRARGEGVRFDLEASDTKHIQPNKKLPPRTIGRISLHEEADEAPKEVGIHDKNFIHAFITGATTRGTVLFLHKKSRKQSFIQPSKMTTFLKLGSEQADGNFGGPKFVWVAYDGVQAGRTDLFDIRSVDKATPLQLQHYPLAMPGRSLVIKMNRSPDCVFEAIDEEAAMRFVHGMRWVVARLAFNLIIGNMNVSCELLDIGRHEDSKQKTRILPESPVEEAQWNMAMNDLTNHLVDKAAAFTTL